MRRYLLAFVGLVAIVAILALAASDPGDFGGSTTASDVRQAEPAVRRTLTRTEISPANTGVEHPDAPAGPAVGPKTAAWAARHRDANDELREGLEDIRALEAKLAEHTARALADPSLSEEDKAELLA